MVEVGHRQLDVPADGEAMDQMKKRHGVAAPRNRDDEAAPLGDEGARRAMKRDLDGVTHPASATLRDQRATNVPNSRRGPCV